ncbi:MAG: ATP-binding cassette domain-containing protein [Casimicrobiaceae bacterium]
MRFDVDIAKRVTAQGRRFDLAVKFEADTDRLALYGPSGAGKSLTLQALAGLIRPDRGRIAIDGDVWFDAEQRINRPTRARRVGFVFQNYALFPHRTVEQNVAAARMHWYPHSLGIAEQRELAALLEAFGLHDIRRSYPEQLSGGQRQRTALARALAARPLLLLLDEPFAALDSALRLRLRADLLAVQRRFAVPMVLITHDADDLAQCADRVVTMRDGVVVADTEGTMPLPIRAAPLPAV